ncbi:MAG: PEP-CTERM sorting domain-containing protein [Terracidiphilus sp.]|jgi:hypothetical protein
MKKFSIALLALATALAIAPSAMADTMITGTLGIGGPSVTWGSGNSATNYITFGQAAANVTGGTGQLNTFTYLNPATINAYPTLSLLNPADEVLLFTSTENGDTTTFTITGPITISTDTSGFLNISGLGTLTETGYIATTALFNLSATDSNNDFGEGGSSNYVLDLTSPAPGTPEPSSLLLLGTGLLGLAVVLFRKVKTSAPALHS